MTPRMHSLISVSLSILLSRLENRTRNFNRLQEHARILLRIKCLSHTLRCTQGLHHMAQSSSTCQTPAMAHSHPPCTCREPTLGAVASRLRLPRRVQRAMSKKVDSRHIRPRDPARRGTGSYLLRHQCLTLTCREWVSPRRTIQLGMPLTLPSPLVHLSTRIPASL